MKLRLIIITIYCVVIHISISAQDYSNYFISDCDTLIQSGYLVTINEKNIIKKILKNRKREKENKSYELVYSLSGLDIIFIPFDSIEANNKFLTIMNNHFESNSVNVYTLYQSLNEADYKFLRGLETEFSPKWPDIRSDYYELAKAQSKFCFRILSLTAQWVRIKVPSLEVAYSLVGRKARHLKKHGNYYEIYILKGIISCNINPNLENIPIKIWRRTKSLYSE